MLTGGGATAGRVQAGAGVTGAGPIFDQPTLRTRFEVRCGVFGAVRVNQLVRHAPFRLNPLGRWPKFVPGSMAGVDLRSMQPWLLALVGTRHRMAALHLMAGDYADTTVRSFLGGHICRHHWGLRAFPGNLGCEFGPQAVVCVTWATGCAAQANTECALPEQTDKEPCQP